MQTPKQPRSGVGKATASHRLVTWVPNTLHEWLQAKAASEGLTVSALVRRELTLLRRNG